MNDWYTEELKKKIRREAAASSEEELIYMNGVFTNDVKIFGSTRLVFPTTFVKVDVVR